MRDAAEQTVDPAAEAAIEACGHYKVVMAAGRLAQQKGFDLLLRAFAEIAPRRSGWRLAIFGDGPESTSLREMTRDLGLSGLVIFPGFSRTLHLALRKSQLFVLSSRYEGMPNVLAEAMAWAVPCISFDCPTGPAELISHGRNGLLVPPQDVGRLAAAMDRLMGDDELRRQFGKAAEETVKVYSLGGILDRWNTVLGRILNPARAENLNGLNASEADKSA